MAELKFHTSINEICSSQWDALWRTPSVIETNKAESPNIQPYPFTQHAFLKILEDCQSTTPESGWQVNHAALWDGDNLLAAMPLYQKSHSYGEYVFDWAWADAYHRNNLNYYPKWVCAIPFTPSTGPRIGIAIKHETHDSDTLKNTERQASYQQIAQELQQKIIDQIGLQACSSLHYLFPDKHSQSLLNPKLLDIRYGTQFHWFNQEFKDFSSFLNQLTSRKRKNIVKERLKVNETGLQIKMRNAHDISDQEWQRFYQLYQITYLKRSGHTGYLNQDFFLSIAKHLPDQVLLASAHNEQQMIAAALYFRDSSTLYGRYWGALEEYDSLHFECCYYQGIEYAIAQKLQRFDPGAQGEHKIQRGFTPINTCSFHYIQQPQFKEAIQNFLIEERSHVEDYTQVCNQRLPFKEGCSTINVNHLLTDDYAL